jgi:hypothetical protein
MKEYSNLKILKEKTEPSSSICKIMKSRGLELSDYVA